MGGDQFRSTSSLTYPRYANVPVGKQIHAIFRDRLPMFTQGGQYEKDGLNARIIEGKASGDPSVKLYVYSPPSQTRPSFEDAVSKDFKPTAVGESFGPSWSTHWFKILLTVPADLRKKEHLEFHWNANNEGLVWTEAGEPLHGLTGGGEREEWILPKEFRDGKEHTFYIEMACNSMFGNPPGGDVIQPPSPSLYFKLEKADIVAINLEARALAVDFQIIGDGAREFPEDSWEEHKALQIGNDIMDNFIHGGGSPECIVECRKIAQKYLGNKVDSADVYDDSEALITAIGHCHIDTSWLWPWDETKRKVARSWANQCDLIERYPEHRFAASSAQQWSWLESLYPKLYDRVKGHVKDGSFQPIGGSWVEHDTNLPGGESLVRQFLYGQRYFESRFGERSKTFWLPDTFGYSAQIPQLCRLAGMPRFFTQKLSWNNINKFPHTTFNWVALDGSQVLCHMCPAETYTSEANFGDVKRSVTQHKSMDQAPESLLVFGKGDGGGGPTFTHLERLRRCRGLSDKVGLLPKLKMGDSVDDFFSLLEKKAENGTEFVTWYGELYLELHRGTYTSQSRNKYNNRKIEVLLHDIEWLATLASLKDIITSNKFDYKYPKKELDEIWENVLLMQFHDILPGSCIEMVYKDCDKLYSKLFKKGHQLLEGALQALGFHDASSGKGVLVGINTLPWERFHVVDMPQLPHMPSHGLFHGGRGLTPIKPVVSNNEAKVSIREIENGVFELSNSQLKIEVSSGAITSIFDKSALREVVPKGSKANQLVIYDDKPLYWQAWDVEVYHLRSRQELNTSESTIAENGPHRVSVVTTTRISEKSWIKSTISLSATADGQEAIQPMPSLIEVACEIEWQEDKKFLKVEFPVDVRNTQASYETQYGIITRPTHYNTTWDVAKFEVCCHKWADLSEAGYGVSILNDSKYGFATQGNVMRLSLLRAPKAPDAHADLGFHKFRYAIMPHAGPLDSRTVRAGFEFNHPMTTPLQGLQEETDRCALFPYTSMQSYVRTHSAPATIAPLLSSLRMASSSAPGIILDTIKRGEDDEDVSRGSLPARKGRSIVFRAYESLGGKSRGRLLFGVFPIKKVFRTNLLEDDEAEVEIDETGFDIELGVFEVQTFRLVL